MKNSRFSMYLSNAASEMLLKLQKADMVTRKGGRSIVWLLLLAITPLAAQKRASDVKVILSFAKFCSQMARQSGIKYLVLYLKASQVLLQQAVGGQVLPDTRPLKAAVSRSRGGFPRVIPRQHRLLIKAMSRREIRLWMTLLGLYRVLGFEGVVSTATITNPGKIIPGTVIVGFQRFVHDHFFKMASSVWGFTPLLRQAIVRNVKGKIALWTEFMGTLTAKQFEVAKSSPTTSLSKERKYVSTSGASLAEAAGRWSLPQNAETLDAFRQWLEHTNSRWVFESMNDAFQKRTHDIWVHFLGKLSLKEEAAGKIRVFAMVDAFTQWALYPLHQGIMRTISLWRQDGTFDQYAPVKELLRQKPSGLWSYDLSAATDRLPLQVQKILLQPILGLHGAEAWGNLLVKRDYCLGSKALRYQVGQPMGAYSSWAMLALTHHALVQWAWYRVCVSHQRPYTWFKLYAVLGDDVIIGHAEVAATYLEIMSSLGVEVGLAKSLVSPKKLVGEFAKRFFIPREASMIPLKEVVAARYNLQEMIQFVRKYRLDVRQMLSFSGVGYKVKGSLNKRFCELGSRTRNLLLIASHPSSPLGVGLLSWLQSRGWGRLGKAMSAACISEFMRSEFMRVLERVKSRRSGDGKVVWQMMMVKRDHGNRYNPYDYLYDRYPAVLKKLDGFTYELSEIERLLQAELSMSQDLSGWKRLEDLERRLDALPKPTDFEERAEVKPRFDSLKPVRIWRSARAVEQSLLSKGKSKDST